jgi:hypothetical protein
VNNDEDGDWDGVGVKYTVLPRSRISIDIIKRWDLERLIYDLPVKEDEEVSKVNAIDLTWGLEGKTYKTTFEVVPDNKIDSDAEFGQNRFEIPYSRKAKKAHSVSSMDIYHKSHLSQLLTPSL